MTVQSTTPTNTQRAGANRKALILLIITCAMVFAAISFGGTWFNETPAQVEAQQSEVGTLAVGNVFNFDTEHGNVALTVAALDGSTVIVTDGEGDRIAMPVAQLTGGTLPASDTDAAAARMLETVKRRAASGYYVRNAGVNGAHD